MVKRMVKKQEKESIRTNTPLLYIMLFSVIFAGGYHNYIVFFIGIILVLLLSGQIVIRKSLILPSRKIQIAFNLLLIGHLFVLPFAVSFGTALAGFLRILVLYLFALYCSTYTEKERHFILDWLAYEGVFFGILTTIFFLMEPSNLNGRVDGLFEYANTWCIYLCFCFLWLFQKYDKKITIYMCLMFITLGMFMTGSRAVLLIWVFALGVESFLLYRTKKDRSKDKLKKTMISIGSMVVGITILLFVADYFMDGLLFYRLEGISTSSSSVNGRLLYYMDGIKMITSHPMGIGWGGYIYLQPLFQTGIYVTKYIHNDYLQMFLNGGILGGVGFLLLVGSYLQENRKNKGELVILLCFALHFLVDFDGEFMVILFLFVLLGTQEKGKMITFTKEKLCVPFGFCLSMVLFFFSGVYFLQFTGNKTLAYELYPYDLTIAEDYLEFCVMVEGSNNEVAKEVANHISKMTTLSSLTCDYFYKVAVVSGNKEEIVSAKWDYLQLNKYEEDAYRELVSYLENGLKNDVDDLYYIQMVSLVKEMLIRVEKETSPLAYRIYDVPDFFYVEELLYKLEQLESS